MAQPEGGKCPKCYSFKTEHRKAWEITSPTSSNTVLVELRHCKACRKNYRVYE